MKRVRLLLFLLTLVAFEACREVPQERWSRLQHLRHDLLKEESDICLRFRSRDFLTEFENIQTADLPN